VPRRLDNPDFELCAEGTIKLYQHLAFLGCLMQIKWYSTQPIEFAGPCACTVSEAGWLLYQKEVRLVLKAKIASASVSGSNATEEDYFIVGKVNVLNVSAIF